MTKKLMVQTQANLNKLLLMKILVKKLGNAI